METTRRVDGGFDAGLTPVFSSMDLDGKMKWVISVSTSCVCNERCLLRMMHPEWVCSHCFSKGTHEQYKAAREHYIDNTTLLQGRILEEHELPHYAPSEAYTDMLRFESFGDLGSVEQVINFVNIAKENTLKRCALFTKNPDFLYKAGKLGYTKPENMCLILSSKPMNEVDPAMLYWAKRLEEVDWHVDGIFTVFTPEYLAEHPEIIINCGGNSCSDCQRCYIPHEETQMIYEEVK